MNEPSCLVSAKTYATLTEQSLSSVRGMIRVGLLTVYRMGVSGGAVRLDPNERPTASAAEPISRKQIIGNDPARAEWRRERARLGGQARAAKLKARREARDS